MRTRHSGSTILSLILAAVLFGAAGPARGGTYLWQNSSGGSWDQPSNWGSTSYPRFFFDFALFTLDASFAIDASDVTRVTPVGIIMVDRGDLSLATHANFGGVLAVGGGSQPATLQLTSGSIFAAGTHTIGPQGTVVLSEATLLRSSASGEVGLSIASGGRLEGSGTALDGRTLRNGGVVSPGFAPGGAGVLTIGSGVPATYQQTASGVLEIDLGAAEPGTGYDQLQVVNARGPVILDGVLRVRTRDGFAPGTESRYVVLTAPDIQGTFAGMELPEIPGVTFSVEVGPDRVEVIAVGAVDLVACFAVQPGSTMGSLGVNKKGVLPTAILDSNGVPATSVDPFSVRLAGVAPLRWSFEDVGGACDAASPEHPDGRDDLTLKFDAQAILAAIGESAPGDTIALPLEGSLDDGSSFTGTGWVVLRGSSGKKSKSTGAGDVSLSVRAFGEDRGSNPSLELTLPGNAPVQVQLFDISGRLVRDLGMDSIGPGTHRIDWDARGLASGVYFYRVASGLEVVTVRMTLVR